MVARFASRDRPPLPSGAKRLHRLPSPPQSDRTAMSHAAARPRWFQVLYVQVLIAVAQAGATIVISRWEKEVTPEMLQANLRRSVARAPL